MKLRKKKERMSTEINAGSMADIAFLLLIFFLVTTTINSEEGLPVLLPPYSEEEPDPIDKNARNIFKVLVNFENKIFAESEPIDVKDLRDATKEFVMNPNGSKDLAEKPSVAVVSLINDRSTNYDVYLQVYNELKGAYNELWEEASQSKYGVSYEKLPKKGRDQIQDEIPLVISEAEPVDVKGGG